MVLQGSPRDYSELPTPDQVGLAVEVSVTSLGDDLGWKKNLYALVEIPEYWVVDVNGRRAILHRRPEGGEYRSIEVLHEEYLLPELGIRLADVLP